MSWGADDIPTPAMSIPRVERAPTLDDFLEGVAREAELEVTDFRQYQPGDGVAVSQPTTAYLSYDDKNLYVAFRCFDTEPENIERRMSRRDNFPGFRSFEQDLLELEQVLRLLIPRLGRAWRVR